jgi:uncharacterized protein YwqG
MSGGNGGSDNTKGQQGGQLSTLGPQDLMNAYLEAEIGYQKSTGAVQQHWFDRRVEIAAEFSARFGPWPDPKRSAEDPAARPYRTPTDDEIAAFSESELEQLYVESIEAAEATDHAGRQKRFIQLRFAVIRELKSRGLERAFLRRFTEHADPQVREHTSAYLLSLDEPANVAMAVPRSPLRPEITWQCDYPPPLGLTRGEIAARLRESVPRECDRLMRLALPAIRLWPQRRADVPADTSRFGGTPVAPRDWQWPTHEAEPLLFIGQVNCAELSGLPGAELLPATGLLAFFGDHDAVTGCFPFSQGGVYHWPDIDRLVPTQAPIEPADVFLSCALIPQAIIDLPHPSSHAVTELDLTPDEQNSYHTAWLEIRHHGIPEACAGYAGFSKLLGWPDVVQDELSRFSESENARLLLQVDAYCNGEDMQHYGPGGSLYYVLPEESLRAQRYEDCELEGQFT